MEKGSRRTLLLLLLLISSALHLVFLDKPRSVVFDEVHFGKFINAYCCSGRRFFDIHPPHGKLLIAAAVSASGYDGGFGFETIGNEYGKTPIYAFRLIPAASGIAISLILFILIMQLGASRAAAFFGALLVTLDNAFLVQTRIIAIDGILLTAIFGSLCLFIAARGCENPLRRNLLLLLCGGAAGLAVGIKFTGLTALALPFAFAAVRVAADRSRPSLAAESKNCLLILAGTVAVYLTGWYLHFALLPADGPGDAFYWPKGNFFTDLFKMHSVMLRYNYFLGKTHSYSSPWWGWPLMTRPIFYWSGPKAGIYFLGNPAVWWGGTLAFVGALAWRLSKFWKAPGSKLTEKAMMAWLPVAGFLISYLPHVGIPRVLFMYHYLPPLLFSLVFFVRTLDDTGWILKGGIARQRPSYWGAMALVAAGFLFISPVTFGWTYPNWYERILFGWLFPR